MSDDEKLGNELGARMRQLETQITAEESARLTAIRSAALRQLDEPSALAKLGDRLWSPQLLGAGAFAVAAVVIGLVLLPGVGIEPMPEFEAGEFLVAQEVELLQDLEFAAWVSDLEEMNEQSRG